MYNNVLNASSFPFRKRCISKWLWTFLCSTNKPELEIVVIRVSERERKTVHSSNATQLVFIPIRMCNVQPHPKWVLTGDRFDYAYSDNDNRWLTTMNIHMMIIAIDNLPAHCIQNFFLEMNKQNYHSLHSISVCAYVCVCVFHCHWLMLRLEFWKIGKTKWKLLQRSHSYEASFLNDISEKIKIAGSSMSLN